MRFSAEDKSEIVHGIVTVVHAHLDIVEDASAKVLCFVYGKYERLPFSLYRYEICSRIA